MVDFPPKSSILIGISISFTIHFGVSPIFGNLQKFDRALLRETFMVYCNKILIRPYFRRGYVRRGVVWLAIKLGPYDQGVLTVGFSINKAGY